MAEQPNNQQSSPEAAQPSFWDSWRQRLTVGRVIVAVLLLLLLLFLYWFRAAGIIHQPVMVLYTWPLLWFLPLLAIVLVSALWAGKRLVDKRRQPAEEEGGSTSGYYRSWNYQRQRTVSGWLWSALGLATLGFVVALVIQSPLNSQATYNYYQFTTSKNFPALQGARIMPLQVADKISASGFGSSTERLGAEHIYVDQQGRLQWSFAQLPNGFFRYWTKKTAGQTQQSAEQTSRDLQLQAGEFKYSPSIGLTDNLYWQLYKRDYFSQIAATVFMFNERQEPVIVAPFIKYRGFLTKAPYLGGVYVIDQGGEINEYSPQQAAELPWLANSGQLFPGKLAREVQESYKYKGGIWNRFFIHEDQIEIADTEENVQPYLMTFAGRRPQWVSTAEPYGRSYATKAIFLTDSVSGKTTVWRPGQEQTLSGNARALEVVRGLAIPGILFNKFRAIEPRPVLVDQRLKFIVSVVPNNLNNVTKTVIVDAASNKAEKIFNHDSDPQADQQLRQYLQTGVAPENEESAAAEPERPGSEPAINERQLLQRLLQANRQQGEIIEQLLQQLAEK